jgi:hypothetical protein
MELLDLFTSQLGESADQARGGAGALFHLAKHQLGRKDFGQKTAALPGVETLLNP